MNKNFTKLVAGSAAAMLLLPTLALAHEGDNKGKNTLQHRIEVRLDKAERHEKHDDDNKVKNASTTAAKITKQAVRVQAAADTMLSFNARISALIASSSADSKAALQAKFAQFQTGATNARLEAGKAITGSAQVNASNSTTTNASLLAAAKVDLKEARGFLHDAKEAFFSVLRSLWN